MFDPDRMNQVKGEVAFEGDIRWWKHEDDRLHEVLGRTMMALAELLKARRNRMHDMLHRYTDRVGDASRSDIGADVAANRKRRDNIIANACEMVQAWVGRANLRPWVVTTGGDLMLRLKAEDLSKYLEGEMKRCAVQEKLSDALLDSCVVGLGLLKIVPDHDAGNVSVDRIWPSDVLVDPREAFHNSVRTMYQVFAMDRWVAAEKWPEHEVAILELPLVHNQHHSQQGTVSELVEIWEAWRLPSGPDSNDGKHVIACANACFYAEEWKRNDFPFVEIRAFKHPTDAFDGIGYAEKMVGAQDELDWVSSKISDAFARIAPAMVVDVNADPKIEQIENEPWYILEVKGGASSVSWSAPPAIHPQFLEREEMIISRAMNMVGLSEVMSTGQTPEALRNSSGKALLVHEDLQSGRLYPISKRYENAHVAVAEKIIAATEDLVEEGSGKKLEVLIGKDSLRRISYKDVRFSKQVYDIRVYPVSALSHSPQGRLNEVEKLMQFNLIASREQALELINLPDLEYYYKTELSWMQLIDRMIEAALRDGDKPFADPHMAPFEDKIEHVRKKYFWAQSEGAPEEKLELLRAFIADLIAENDKLKAAAAAQMQPPPMAGPAAVPALPMPMQGAM